MLIADCYLVEKRWVVVDDLYTMRPDAAAFSWFIGAGVAFALHRLLSRRQAAPTPA